jgi:hypothetical protein
LSRRRRKEGMSLFEPRGPVDREEFGSLRCGSKREPDGESGHWPGIIGPRKGSSTVRPTQPWQG